MTAATPHTDTARPQARPDGGDAAGIPDADWDPDAKERRNVTVLLRWIAAFIAWPSLSLGLIFTLEWQDHMLHIVGLVPLGVAALVLFWQAPRIASRFYPQSA